MKYNFESITLTNEKYKESKKFASVDIVNENRARKEREAKKLKNRIKKLFGGGKYEN